MLKIKIETEEGTAFKNILVIDAHSHLGKDVDGAQNMNPSAPGGTFDFWSQTQGMIENAWKSRGGKTIEVRIRGKDHILTFDFEKMPFVDTIYRQLEKINSSAYKDLAKISKDQQFIDQAVVFPFQDVFRDKKKEALYRASNLNVARFTTRFPFSLRLIGYMRCNPMEGKKAVNEVENGYKLGVRGLKLHPRSDGWIDNVNSQNAINVMAKAAQYSFPVIFDTRGKASILAIGELVKSTRSYLQANMPKLLRHFKVIIAHFAQGNVGDEEVYRTICQPNTWGDLSMLHGAGASNFIADFRKWFIANNMKKRVDGRDWSQFILYASDFPYFGAQHAKGLALPLMSEGFFNSGGTLRDLENIFGLNQLRLLPEYNYQLVEKAAVPAMSSIVSTPNLNLNALDVAVQAVARLIDEGMIEINKLLFQFDGNYRTYKGEVLLETTAKKKQNKMIRLIIMNLVPDKLTMLSTLGKDNFWKKFGYRYFNPQDRQFFHSAFGQTQAAINENQAFEMIKKAF
ncbi:MAG: hypothetical protein GF364_02025 [Candidatus Lokiarchaeota archaeon]|nr:hypothetical protein [Candidatus Lokiarchaeota archaeon]